jgi:hypothetical protein
MMKNNLFICLVLALVCWSSDALSQNAFYDLRQAGKKLEAKKFKLKMKYVLFETYASRNSIEEKNFTISSWGKELKVNVEGIDIVRTKDKNIYVDHLHKVMILHNEDKADKQDQFSELSKLVNIDSLIMASLTVTMLKAENNQKVYRIKYAKGNIYNYSDVYINQQTSLIDKICVFYAGQMNDLLGKGFEKSDEGKQRPRLEIIFTQYQFPETRSKTDFTISKFANKKGGKYIMAQAFSAYEFYDYTSIK